MRRVLQILTSAFVIASAQLGVADVPREESSREHVVRLPNPLAELYFAFGSARLDPDAPPVLGAVARWLVEHPYRLVFIEGYTDRTGSRAANLRLSGRRADAVRDELVRLGADPVRLVRVGYGERRATDNARESRRVVLRGSILGYPDLIESQRRPTRRDDREARR